MTATTYTSNGTPSDNTGVQGDMNIDYGNKFLWGPKGATSWTGTASSIVGPTGPAGAVPQLTTMSNFANTYGPMAQMSAASLAAGVATQAFIAGSSTMLNSFTPQVGSALMGYNATNYGATGVALSITLMDVAANTVVMPAVSLANGTINQVSFSSTQYRLTAGRTYAWYVTRAAAGTATIVINPIYLTPSATPSCITLFGSNVMSSTSIASGGTYAFNPAGLPAGQTSYMSNALPMYLQSIQVYISGSGNWQPFIYADTAGANFWNSTQTPPAIINALSSTPTLYTFGPYAANQYPFTPSSRYYLSNYAPSGAVTITSAVAYVYVGQ